MKRILLLMTVLAFVYNNGMAQCGNLYIAGVIDGPLGGGTPKAVQVCTTGDIADLSIYGLGSANNGGGSDGQEFTFPAEEISSGNCFWISSNGSAGGVTHVTRFNEWFGFDPCYSAAFANINGDDAIELFCSGSVVDVFGEINNDGTGTCWDYTDGWATATDMATSTTFSCPAPVGWSFSGANALDGESTNAGAGANGYPSPAQVCPMVPVPVELITFEGKAQNEMVDLSWSTASEDNNSHFEIEHSTDGQHFNYVAKVNGVGTTSEIQNYQFTHEAAAAGKNYYRLRQVDFDGAFEYSSVVVITLRADAAIELRPNLVSSSLQLILDKPFTKDASLRMVDITGRSLKANTLSAGAAAYDLDVADLEKGIYFVQVNVAGEIITRRFVKL